MSSIDPKDVEERLSSMQAQWKEAKPEFTPGDRVDDGVYQTVIKDFDFFEGKNGVNAGKFFIKTVFEIRHDRKFNGAEESSIHNLEDPEKFNYLKRHFLKLGVDVDTLPMAELRPGSDTLRGLLDVPVEIAVKTSDAKDINGVNYVNTFVNQRLGDSLGSDVTPQSLLDSVAKPAETADDSVPF